MTGQVSTMKGKGGSALNRITAMGLLITLGIVFGDIGTSPLYVMKAITGVNPGFDTALAGILVDNHTV